jgi:hypothetical protein
MLQEVKSFILSKQVLGLAMPTCKDKLVSQAMGSSFASSKPIAVRLAVTRCFKFVKAAISPLNVSIALMGITHNLSTQT